MKICSWNSGVAFCS